MHTLLNLIVLAALLFVNHSMHADSLIAPKGQSGGFGFTAPEEEEPAESVSTASPYADDSSDYSDPDSEEDIYVLPEFVVQASAEDKGYFSANSSSVTRTNTLVKNAPMSLTVVNEQLLEDLNIFNDDDLARTTASVTRDPDGFSFNQIRIRGFRSLTQRYDWFWREIERDSYNIQRVDIVKGANSLIYGQADPGGKVNSVPKMADHKKSFGVAKGTVGNKEFRRFEVDVNAAVSEKLAMRVMAVDFSREFDQTYEYQNLTGGTVELSYRPTQKTFLRAHLEKIALEQNLQPGMFRDATGTNRFAPNSTASESDTNQIATLTAYRNEFVYNQDAVAYLPDEVINDLLIQGNPDPTRADVEALYAPWADQNTLYTAHGPDKINDREGTIVTLDWTQKITDNIETKIAFNREDDDRSALTRDGFSGSRVVGPIGGENINTHWQRIDGKTESNALKATLLWEVELDKDSIIPLPSQHNLLFGYDFDQLKKNPTTYDQVKDSSFLGADAPTPVIDPATSIAYPEYYYNVDIFKEQLFLSEGFAPGTSNPIRYNGREDLFRPFRTTDSEVVTNSLWFATQSKFFNGRLRTLAGIRYDKIDIDHSFNENRISVGTGFLNVNADNNPNNDRIDGDGNLFTPDDLVTNINNNEVTYDQFSPSVGAVFWINDKIGVFGNYAQSIQSPTGVDIDPFGDVIPPVYGEGWEVGMRFDLMNGKLNGQVVYFYIEKENDNIVNYDFRLADVITPQEYLNEFPGYFRLIPNGDPTDPNDYRLINDVLPSKQVAGDVSRSEGIEVEFYYNPISNLSFVFSYTYNNLDAIKIHPSVNPRFAQVFGLAPHRAVVIGRYKFKQGPLKGITIGGSQNFRSASTMGSYYIQSDNAWYDVEFDPEFVTDAFINYETRLGNKKKAPKLNLGFNVQNVFNENELVNRNTSAFYRESTQFQFSGAVRF